MDYKKAGWLFFTITVIHELVSITIKIFPEMPEKLSVGLRLFLGEGLLLFALLIFLVIACIRTRENPLHILGFHKMKIGTVFLMFLYGLFIIPISLLTNLISLLFTKNVVTESISDISGAPLVMIILIAGVAGPVIEEMTCRGMIFGGMRKNMSAVAAVLMSAFAFGLIHMNLNQFMYATVIGVFAALAVEGTGSLWASIIVHMTINTEQTLLMALTEKISPGFYSSSAVETYSSREYLLMVIPFYLIVAGVFTCLAVGILILSAHHEGRLSVLGSLTKTPEGGVRGKEVITIPYLLGVILSVGYIVVYEWKNVWTV